MARPRAVHIDGLKLKTAREDRGLTQFDVSEKARCDETTLRDAENFDKCSRGKLELIVLAINQLNEGKANRQPALSPEEFLRNPNAASNESQPQKVEVKQRHTGNESTTCIHSQSLQAPGIIDLPQPLKSIQSTITSIPSQPYFADRRWACCVAYPLQPAPHFVGRAELLKRLSEWAVKTDTPNRVVAISAPDGTGKTAILNRLLHLLDGYSGAGVFVWNFFENPRTDAFLRAACMYFFNDVPSEAGELIERFQRGFRTDDCPHLLILDGLECHQSTAARTHAVGELTDPLIRRFLCWLTVDPSIKARALITSRLSLPDLQRYCGRGFVEEQVNDLQLDDSIAILRAWGVPGNEPELRTLLQPFHAYPTNSAKALTISLLGSYLGKMCAGTDSTFTHCLTETNGDSTAGLHGVLAKISEGLTDLLRDLLVRLATVFSCSTLEHFTDLATSGAELAGSLVDLDQLTLRKAMSELRDLGLIYSFPTSKGSIYRMHPDVRAFFATLLPQRVTTSIHRAMWRNESPHLLRRLLNHTSAAQVNFGSGADIAPRDSIQLLERSGRESIWSVEEQQLLEDLIDLSLPTDRIDSTWTLYYNTLGHAHRFRHNQDHSLNLRLLRAFLFGTSGSNAFMLIGKEGIVSFYNHIAMAGIALGDLTVSRWAYQTVFKLNEHTDYRAYARTSQAEIEGLAGRWQLMQSFANDATECVTPDDFNSPLPEYCRSLASLKRGEITRKAFLENLAKIDFKLSKDRYLADVGVHSENGLGLPELNIAMANINRTGDVSEALCGYFLGAKSARLTRKFSIAISEAVNGIELAESCGFGAWLLDIRTELSKTYLAAGNPHEAIGVAMSVLNRSYESDCQYAWGIADSLLTLGVAHAELGDITKARDYLKLSFGRQISLEHDRVRETQVRLAQLEHE